MAMLASLRVSLRQAHDPSRIRLISCGTRHASVQSTGPLKPSLVSRLPRGGRSAPKSPEELFPESFPREGELVNPSGRIYSVQRPVEVQDPFAGSKTVLVTPQEAKAPPIWGALAFLLGGSSLIFLGAAAYQNKETDRLVREIRSHSPTSSVFRSVFGDFSSFFTGGGVVDAVKGGAGVTQRQLMAAKKHEEAERHGWRLMWLLGWCDQLHLPRSVKELVGRTYTFGAESYLELAPYKQALVPVVAVNTAVFLGWRLGMLRPLQKSLYHFMATNFLHAPAAGRSYTTLTSTFSHMGGLHFLFNNIALWSIGAGFLLQPGFLSAKGNFNGGGDTSDGMMLHHSAEPSLTPHFLAFFATAGIFSATASHLVTAVRFRMTAAKLGLDTAKTLVGRIPSLGSSGAVYSAFVMSALAYPDARISLIFLPMFTLPIGTGVGCMVAADMLGVLRGWKAFDHVAHLGGAAFGYGYWYYGNEVWERARRQAMAFQSRLRRSN